MKIAMIMLAAGNSRRFGGNKLLHPVDGKPMYVHTLEKLLQVREAFAGRLAMCITVVTQYEEIEKNARRSGVQVLYNPHPEDGISGSLQIGLKANLTADACLFAVSDQPWLTAATVCGLTELFLKSGKGIACISAGGKSGNPCIFSKKYYPELMKLWGDTGGKHVITAHRDDTILFEAADQKELTDIDTCGE